MLYQIQRVKSFFNAEFVPATVPTYVAMVANYFAMWMSFTKKNTHKYITLSITFFQQVLVWLQSWSILNSSVSRGTDIHINVTKMHQLAQNPSPLVTCEGISLNWSILFLFNSQQQFILTTADKLKKYKISQFYKWILCHLAHLRLLWRKRMLRATAS